MTPTPPDALNARLKEAIEEEGRAYILDRCAHYELLVDAAARIAELEPPAAVAGLHASAPSGYKCSDCTIGSEPCPICYEAWWRQRHPHHTYMPPAADAAPLRTLRELVRRWRYRADGLTSDREVMRDDRVRARTFRDCADDLDALLPKETP